MLLCILASVLGLLLNRQTGIATIHNSISTRVSTVHIIIGTRIAPVRTITAVYTREHILWTRPHDAQIHVIRTRIAAVLVYACMRVAIL